MKLFPFISSISSNVKKKRRISEIERMIEERYEKNLKNLHFNFLSSKNPKIALLFNFSISSQFPHYFSIYVIKQINIKQIVFAFSSLHHIACPFPASFSLYLTLILSLLWCEMRKLDENQTFYRIDIFRLV